MDQNGQDQIQTKLIKIDPATLRGIDKNARFMSHVTFNRLVENIKKDGKLTSVPLVCKDGSEFVVLSGNHRVAAAVKAKLTEIDVMLIIEDLPPKRRRALQLSHNSVAGQDDQNVLRELYDELDSVYLKEYSGVNENDFGFDEVDIASLLSLRIEYKELIFFFLPEKMEKLDVFLKRLKDKSSTFYHCAKYDSFNKFFDVLIKTKKIKQIFNNAIALDIMVTLAEQRLLQVEHEEKQRAESIGGDAPAIQAGEAGSTPARRSKS